MSTIDTLDLIELFASVQGETSFTGLPTTFIRLAKCNLRCSWCDTTYSFKRGTPQSLPSILSKVEELGCRHICITGGEPLMQPTVHKLMKELCDRSYVVSLETGGSLTTASVDPRVHIILDIKCPGSGMSEKNYWHNLTNLKPHDQVKFVLADENDYEYARAICEKHDLYNQVSEVLLSPVHDVLNSQQLVSWILRDKLQVRLNLQIHKFIWSPTTQGV